MQMADRLGVTLDLRDISESDTALAELLEKGGKQQVPYLVDVDKNVAMYESDDIIEYVRDTYAQVTGGSEPVKPRIHVSGSACVSCEG